MYHYIQLRGENRPPRLQELCDWNTGCAECGHTPELNYNFEWVTDRPSYFIYTHRNEIVAWKEGDKSLIVYLEVCENCCESVCLKIYKNLFEEELNSEGYCILSGLELPKELIQEIRRTYVDIIVRNRIKEIPKVKV